MKSLIQTNEGAIGTVRCSTRRTGCCGACHSTSVVIYEVIKLVHWSEQQWSCIPKDESVIPARLRVSTTPP